MPFITRCPACGTLFRVGEDQLGMSDGWVRCGHCADVFDAHLYLEDWADTPQQPPAPQAPSTAQRAPHDPAHPTPRAWVPEPVRQRIQSASPHAQTPAPAHAPVAAAPAPNQPPLGVPAADTPSAGPAPAPHPAHGGSLWRKPLFRRMAEAPAEPEFVRQARRQAFWQSAGTRAQLRSGIALLALLLLLQVLLHERDRLAAAQPALTPVLNALCLPLGCEVQPLRRLEAIVIDSSTLLRRSDNRHAFEVVLQNTAALPLALPALELSLTDSRDTVLAQRVFLPEELPDAPTQLPAHSTTTLRLGLALNLREVPTMAGYRARVFYP
ncbi:MAG: hypothetical protein RLZZ352_1811 [Pseudomonadota bacterium]